jgi:hypothetical protein
MIINKKKRERAVSQKPSPRSLNMASMVTTKSFYGVAPPTVSSSLAKMKG